MSRLPQAVLFVCGQNAVRSPMAAGLLRQLFRMRTYVASARVAGLWRRLFRMGAYWASAGVRKGGLDPFAVAAVDEAGVDIARHKPMTFDELEEWEGLNFDLIVTLSPEAHHKALELTRTLAAEVEYWPTPDPTVAEGSREQRRDAYRG